MLKLITQNYQVFFYLWVSNTFLLFGGISIACFLVSNYAMPTYSKWRTVTGAFAISVLCALVGTLVTISEILQKTFYDVSIPIVAMEIMILLFQAFFIVRLFRRMPKSFSFVLIVIASFLFECLYRVIQMLSASLYTRLLAEATYFGKAIIQITYSIVVTLICTILLSVGRRIKVIKYLHSLMNYPVLSVGLAVAMIVLMHAYDITIMLVKVGTLNKTYYVVYVWGIAVIMVMLFVVVWVTIRETWHKKTKLQLDQQQMYIQQMESVQTKLRALHHDYKNVAAGIYLQAQEGKVEEVREYIGKQLLNLDQDIQMDIQLMNQLTKIENIELKSLILTKLIKAKKENISIGLEVMGETKHIKMALDDLLRCVGILLDNAIEGAAETRLAQMGVALTEDSKGIVCLVSNSVEQKVAFQQIFDKGYSTKGKNRGLGLHNLKEIIYGYENVYLDTESDNQYFVQSLKIMC